VIAASGLKYVGVDTTTLGWLLCGMLLAGASLWLALTQPWRRQAAEAGPSEADALEVEQALRAVEQDTSRDP
jgi:hypothetical protein